jgi:hypothetical protein
MSWFKWYLSNRYQSVIPIVTIILRPAKV